MELVINATAFKARCLALMDDLAAHRLISVVVTKRGKPVAHLTPPKLPEVEQQENDGEYPSWWGCMRDETRVPDGFDWSSLNDLPMPEPDVAALAEVLTSKRDSA